MQKTGKNKYWDEITQAEYDSPDEIYFAWYLVHLQAEGIIRKWKHHTESFELVQKTKLYYLEQLKTKVKLKEKNIMSSLNYTPDFSFVWNEQYEGVFYNILNTDPDKAKIIDKNLFFLSNKLGVTHIDIKNPFNFKDVKRRFSIMQKAVYEIKGSYVQQVGYRELFARTFTPQRYFKTDSGKGKRRLSPISTRTLQDYLNEKRKNN